MCNKQLLSLHPFTDQRGLLCVGSRINISQQLYERCHPLIIPGKHSLTKLITYIEHLRLLHAGPTLVAASLTRCFHIQGAQRVLCSITHECVVCRRAASKPSLQLMDQLPPNWLNPGPVFHQVGVDYTNPLLVNLNYKIQFCYDGRPPDAIYPLFILQKNYKRPSHFHH